MGRATTFKQEGDGCTGNKIPYRDLSPYRQSWNEALQDSVIDREASSDSEKDDKCIESGDSKHTYR